MIYLFFKIVFSLKIYFSSIKISWSEFKTILYLLVLALIFNWFPISLHFFKGLVYWYAQASILDFLFFIFFLVFSDT